MNSVDNSNKSHEFVRFIHKVIHNPVDNVDKSTEFVHNKQIIRKIEMDKKIFFVTLKNIDAMHIIHTMNIYALSFTQFIPKTVFHMLISVENRKPFGFFGKLQMTIHIVIERLLPSLEAVSTLFSTNPQVLLLLLLSNY